MINLKSNQPIKGAEIVALGFHVDYWDHAGWKDRFSSRAYTERQERYAKRFHDEVYTPQLVVDGVHPIQEGRTIPEVVTSAAASPRPLQIELSHQGSTAEIVVRGDLDSGEAYLALVEDGVETSVKSGENQGRKLRHAAVVRDWHPLGRIKGKVQIKLNIPEDANRTQLQLVGFVQDSSSGKILGLQSIKFGD